VAICVCCPASQVSASSVCYLQNRCVLQSNLATGGNSKVSALTGSSDFVTVLGQFTSALFKEALVHNKRCHEACNVWLYVGGCRLYWSMFRGLWGYERSGLHLDCVSCERKCHIFHNHLNCHKSKFWFTCLVTSTLSHYDKALSLHRALLSVSFFLSHTHTRSGTFIMQNG